MGLAPPLSRHRPGATEASPATRAPGRAPSGPEPSDGSAEPDPLYAALVAGVDLHELTSLIAPRPAWHARAACRGAGPEMFFLERGANPRPARALCAACPVADECGTQASAGNEHGIWAGTTARQRRTRPAA